MYLLFNIYESKRIIEYITYQYSFDSSSLDYTKYYILMTKPLIVSYYIPTIQVGVYSPNNSSYDISNISFITFRYVSLKQ